MEAGHYLRCPSRTLPSAGAGFSLSRKEELMYTLAVDVMHSIFVQIMPVLMIFAGIVGVLFGLLIKLVPPLKRGAASTTSSGSSGRGGEDE